MKPTTLFLTPTSSTTFNLNGKHASTHAYICRAALRSIALTDPSILAAEITRTSKAVSVTVTTRGGAGLDYAVLALEIARRFSQVHGTPCAVEVR